MIADAFHVILAQDHQKIEPLAGAVIGFGEMFGATLSKVMEARTVHVFIHAVFVAVNLTCFTQLGSQVQNQDANVYFAIFEL